MPTITEASPTLLTYEAYMAEPETEGRYDIINGMRIYMAGATWEHQTIVGNMLELLRRFGRLSQSGKGLSAPFDVLIRRKPRLQTRQPDVFFISFQHLEQGGGIPAKGPLEVAPELVIEIISDSETQRILGDKLTDYVTAGVEECWVVRPEARTVEVLALTPFGPQTLRLYTEPDAVTSSVFPTLSVPVADVFAP